MNSVKDKIRITTHTLRTPGSPVRDPEKGPLGPNPIPEVGQLSADLTNNGVRLTQLWVIFLIKLNFRVIVDPEWSLAPMDHFRVKFDPGVFRVQRIIVLHIKL